jgi:hypothetical protein
MADIINVRNGFTRSGPGEGLIGIFVEGYCARRQFHPTMPAAIVNGDTGRRKVRIGKRTHGDAHRIIASVFGVEDGSTADWTKSKGELGSLVADTHVLRCGAENVEWSVKAGQCSERTSRPSLAGKAVTNPNALRFAFDFNAQLSTGTTGRPGMHGVPRINWAMHDAAAL